LLDQQTEIRRQADRHEEQAEQQALERLDVGFELVTVLAVGEQEPATKAPSAIDSPTAFDEQRRYRAPRAMRLR
jgi:hypothetical protein